MRPVRQPLGLGPSVKHSTISSTRQRVVVITFASIEQAEEWDRQGRRVEVPGSLDAHPVNEETA